MFELPEGAVFCPDVPPAPPGMRSGWSIIQSLSKFADCNADNTYSGCTAAQCAWYPN